MADMTAREAYLEIEKTIILEQRVDWLIELIGKNECSTEKALFDAKRIKAGICEVLDAPIKDFYERSTRNLGRISKLVEDEIAYLTTWVEARNNEIKKKEA